MGSTSKYSWPTPEQTDLVKDGWDAIKDLGDAADTTVKAVADGRGLVHINTTTSTSAAAISLDNVFTSAYRHYRIQFLLNTSTTAAIQLRLRASGSDDSAADYSTNLSAQNADNLHSASATRTNYPAFYDTGTGLRFAIIDIMNPQLATNTFFNSSAWQSNQQSIAAGGKLTTTQYDGFTLLASTGNISADGIIQVFGYKA